MMRKKRIIEDILTIERPSTDTDARLPWEVVVLVGSRAEGTCPDFFTIADIHRAENAMSKGGIDPDLIRYRFVQRTDLSGLPFMLYAEADDTSEDEENG